MEIVEQVAEPPVQRIYAHPRILLVDVGKTVADALRERGFSIDEGTLGQPYEVERSNKWSIVAEQPAMPFAYEESEIVVLDMRLPLAIPAAEARRVEPAPGVDQWLASHENGVVNPRALAGWFCRSDFDRILMTGGVFLIIAHPQQVQRFRFGRKEAIRRSNWEFLPVFNYFSFGRDEGRDVTVAADLGAVELFRSTLMRYVPSIQHHCWLGAQSWSLYRDAWQPLLLSKYGRPVAGTILPGGNRHGLVLVLPDVGDLSGLLIELLEADLPELMPRLFPDHGQFRWIERAVYQLPEVSDLRAEIERVEQKAMENVEKLERDISTTREENRHLERLLTGTGADLVDAVALTLRDLGFRDVKIVDDEETSQGVLHEDIRVSDKSPTLLIEVKGISHLPKDNDCRAVGKYVTIRMREWDRTDVHGLTIINHQRHIPPLERNNHRPFTEVQLTAATEEGYGLMTSWDLYRLCRSSRENGWSHDVVAPLFNQVGRIHPVPLHYEYVGVVFNYFEHQSVVGLRVESGTLRVGDRIAFELSVAYREQVVESMHVDRNPVDSCQAGQEVGIKTILIKAEGRKGLRVFKVQPRRAPQQIQS